VYGDGSPFFDVQKYRGIRSFMNPHSDAHQIQLTGLWKQFMEAGEDVILIHIEIWLAFCRLQRLANRTQ
jgi:hypothetical protein